VEFEHLDELIAVCPPRELDDIFRVAGGTWEPGNRWWLIERLRIGPVVRKLRAVTDPLFRQAGIMQHHRAPSSTRDAAVRRRDAVPRRAP